MLAIRRRIGFARWAFGLTAALAFGAVFGQAVPGSPTTVRPVSALDRRVTLLATELGLDSLQKVAVKRVLENQRNQVKRVWDDTAMPAASRVGATRNISERTGNQIRALLSEQQKKKYNQPNKPRVAENGTGLTTVEDWMKAADKKPRRDSNAALPIPKDSE